MSQPILQHSSRALRPLSSHLLAALLLLSATAPVALAQPAPDAIAPGETRFAIETITIEGAQRYSPAILISASLLEAGTTYGERELREAVYRIVRLPFILDAEMALRKGSERGRYEVVISVWEARRWFFGYDTAILHVDEPISIFGLATDSSIDSTGSFVGRRFSIGRH